MLFNSYEFIYAFLPIVLVGFAVLGRFGHRNLNAVWLVATPLFFYGWWDVRYVLLLVGSVAVNYVIGSGLARRPNRPLLIVGICANLGTLGWFKYAAFFAENANALTGVGLTVPAIVLPLGISFFTFQQVAFLVDAYRGQVTDFGFARYALFVTFFPQLIAGPIVHHREVMPQYAGTGFGRISREDLAIGVTVFAIGLFKKVILADWTAGYSTPVFDAALAGTVLTPVEAWVGAFAYTFQLYFDFSGYSDMAVGLGWLFGVRLPFNFNSPYKARSIIDFWRRWHITLSRFLRDYLYVPLGGNRRGSERRYVNLGIVMLLGGLWHGAGWTFVLWGALHGLYLMINHGWRTARSHLGFGGQSTRASRALARCVTLLAVVIAWVFFRAESFDAATSILRSMAGLNGLFVPDWMLAALDLQKAELVSGGTIVEHYFANELFRFQDQLGPWMVAMLLIVLYAPNTQEILGRFGPTLDPLTHTPAAERYQARRLAWRPSTRWGAAAGALLAFSTLALPEVHEFLYFQF